MNREEKSDQFSFFANWSLFLVKIFGKHYMLKKNEKIYYNYTISCILLLHNNKKRNTIKRNYKNKHNTLMEVLKI